MPALSIDRGFEDMMARHSWPGNIRELRQVIARAAILEDGPVLRGTHFTPDGISRAPVMGVAQSRQVTVEDIYRAIEQAGGNKSAAATALGISRKTLYAKLAALENSALSDDVDVG